ncbi:hypothetical protein [Acidihalobacter prosperus]|uniref:Uncharacterized protein n=1 Tax=Acidihalobacter prosperus TaxID=160660 RepID=A0A1A6C418_9GAMM|nr:hypothetical protein [Acidihalobacter prosperus]OBS09299.1 hypothetical protein Thpro_021627 [Acidihalobacter prosperus]
MTQSMVWLFVASLALLTLGGLALVRCAFRETLLWGLGVLLLPPLLLWYAITRWQQTQFGLYAIAAALLTMIVSLYGGAAAPVADYLRHSSAGPVLAVYGWNGRIELPFTVDRDIPVPNEAEVAALRQEEAAARKQAQAEAASKAKHERHVTAAPAYRYQPAAFDVLARYTGRKVRVQVLDGGAIEGVLAAVSGDGITVDADQSTGSVGYALAWTRLASVAVYAPAGSVIAPHAPEAAGALPVGEPGTSGVPVAGPGALPGNATGLPQTAVPVTVPAHDTPSPSVGANASGLPANTSIATP